MLLLGAMLTSFAACGDNSTANNKEGNTSTEDMPAGIEAADYNLDFNIYAPDWGMYQRYFFTDDAGTDVMTKALFERETNVENHLGVNIGHTINGSISDIRTKISELVMTGDDTYQLFLTHCITGLSAMITEKLLYDFNDFEYIDMTKDWWNQQALDALSVGGHNYYAISDYMLSDPNCILFNKRLIEEYNLEDPYQLVRNNEWTMDKMAEMMEAVTTDDGNGRWDYNDTWGLGAPDGWLSSGFTFSTGVDFVIKNEDGEFEFAFDNDRAYTMIEKSEKILDGSDTYIFSSMWESSNEERFASETYLDISKDKTLFDLNNVAMLYLYRDSEVDFGVLPYPKLDSTQENYTTNDWSGFMCVPKTVQNEEMVGKVIELLSYFSEDVKYAYYELMLGEKLSRDPESKEMLDTIFDGVSYNAGLHYFGFDSAMNKITFVHDQLFTTHAFGGEFSSFLATYQPQAESIIEQFNIEVAALETTE